MELDNYRLAWLDMLIHKEQARLARQQKIRKIINKILWKNKKNK
jgi:hypothetical protein